MYSQVRKDVSILGFGNMKHRFNEFYLLLQFLIAVYDQSLIFRIIVFFCLLLAYFGWLEII